MCSIVPLFYYVIGNIHPKLRSSLRAIQLIACVTYPNLRKYGFQKILQPFIDDVNVLAEVSIINYGLHFYYYGGTIIYYTQHGIK